MSILIFAPLIITKLRVWDKWAIWVYLEKKQILKVYEFFERLFVHSQLKSNFSLF